jgi:hypothetical protein
LLEPRAKDRTYLQIVESYREGGKVRQRVIATLGRMEELQGRGQAEKSWG